MKIYVFISLLFVSFPSFGAKEKSYLGIEVLCIQSLKNLELNDLCPKKDKKCKWKVIQKSESAKAWQKGDEIRVSEVRNKEALKIFLYNPNKFFEVRTPWCPSVGKIQLPQKIRKIANTLMKEKEVIYVLSEKDKVHLPRLKSIKHPCRKLEKVKLSSAYSFYYLMPQPLKGCQI